jgi:hypothetical protein
MQRDFSPLQSCVRLLERGKREEQHKGKLNKSLTPKRHCSDRYNQPNQRKNRNISWIFSSNVRENPSGMQRKAEKRRTFDV